MSGPAKMKYSVKVLIACMLFFSSAAFSKDVVKVVCFSYPPNMIVDRFGASPGSPKGPVAQVWENYIAPKADVRIVWVGPYPFSRAMLLLENGEADAIQHLSKTPDREIRFIFSQKPVMWGRQGLVIRTSEKTEKISGVFDLKDRKIAMIGEGYLAPFFRNNRKDLDIIEVYGDEAGQQIVRMVLTDRIWGAYFTFPDVLLYYAAADKKINDVKVIPFPGSDSDEVIYAAFSRKLKPDMVKRLDNAITAVCRTYNYPEMVKKVLSDVNK